MTGKMFSTLKQFLVPLNVDLFNIAPAFTPLFYNSLKFLLQNIETVGSSSEMCTTPTILNDATLLSRYVSPERRFTSMDEGVTNT